MVRFIKTILILSGISCFCLLAPPAGAQTNILTDVKVIHAATGKNYIDPNLRQIIPELESVFKYTSYQLIKDKRLHLSFLQEGHVKLPGNRILAATPIEIKGTRIRYRINIKKNNQSVFQTQILLRNNSSITIGGPQFKNGVLLFNISGSIQ